MEFNFVVMSFKFRCERTVFGLLSVRSSKRKRSGKHRLFTKQQQTQPHIQPQGQNSSTALCLCWNASVTGSDVSVCVLIEESAVLIEESAQNLIPITRAHTITPRRHTLATLTQSAPKQQRNTSNQQLLCVNSGNTGAVLVLALKNRIYSCLRVRTP